MFARSISGKKREQQEKTRQGKSTPRDNNSLLAYNILLLFSSLFFRCWLDLTWTLNGRVPADSSKLELECQSSVFCYPIGTNEKDKRREEVTCYGLEFESKSSTFLSCQSHFHTSPIIGCSCNTSRPIDLEWKTISQELKENENPTWVEPYSAKISAGRPGPVAGGAVLSALVIVNSSLLQTFRFRPKGKGSKRGTHVLVWFWVLPPVFGSWIPLCASVMSGVMPELEFLQANLFHSGSSEWFHSSSYTIY